MLDRYKWRVIWNDGCLPICPSVFLSLCQFEVLLGKCLLVFFRFFTWCYIVIEPENWQSLIFQENFFSRMAINKVFQKFWHFWRKSFYVFVDFMLKLILLAFCLLKSHIWESSGSWVMNQNGLSQSDCMIFKSAVYICQEENDGSTWFFGM